MAKIKKIIGRQVFDSRGNPTVEAELFSEIGSSLAIVPSGASTGTHEAYELRDNENNDYLGKSVFKAVENINGPIFKALNNIDTKDQKKIDKILIELDGTEQKKRLGANAILAVKAIEAPINDAKAPLTIFSILNFIFSSLSKNNDINGNAIKI